MIDLIKNNERREPTYRDFLSFVDNTDLFSHLGVFSLGWIQPMQKELADSQYVFMKNYAEKIN
jgi:hypothetical protein